MHRANNSQMLQQLAACCVQMIGVLNLFLYVYRMRDFRLILLKMLHLNN
jgi:hypothetical protein